MHSALKIVLDTGHGQVYSLVVFADTTDTEEFDLDFDLFHDVPRAPSARDLSKVGPLGRNHKNDLADALRVEKRSRRVRPTSKSKVR